jgi:hypothetical protein
LRSVVAGVWRVQLEPKQFAHLSLRSFASSS